MKEKKINLVRVFLFLWLVGALLSFVLHIFYPALTSNLSFWNSSTGWQREIALWNLGVILIIIYNLMKNNYQNYRILAIMLVFVSLLLGTNHLASLIINKKIMIINLLGFVLNYLILVFGLFALRRNDVKKKK